MLALATQSRTLRQICAIEIRSRRKASTGVNLLASIRKRSLGSKSAPELNKSFDRESDAEEWTAQREGEIAKRQVRP